MQSETTFFPNHTHVLFLLSRDTPANRFLHHGTTFKETRDLRAYFLGEQFPNVYLTKREAECMFWLLQSNTIAETAMKMALSARTIEFYIKNLKAKLNCKTKKNVN